MPDGYTRSALLDAASAKIGEAVHDHAITYLLRKGRLQPVCRIANVNIYPESSVDVLVSHVLRKSKREEVMA